MINIAVCDDEEYFAELLTDKIKAYFFKKSIDTSVKIFFCGKPLIESDKGFDIIFLDIKMEAPDGLETARELRLRGFSGEIVFVTCLKEEVFRSFESGAFDYLVKPLGEKDFRRTMDRLYDSLGYKEKRLLIKRKNDWSVVRFSDIVYCEVIDRKVYIHLKNGSVTDYYGKIEELSGKLDNSFFRPHRSYIVNLAYCQSFKAGTICLENGERVPVSRLRAETFLNALAEYMSGGKYNG